MLEFIRSSSLRVAISFAFAIIVATTAIFGLVYLQIVTAEEQNDSVVLTAEAAKGVNDSVEQLQRAFALRLTEDLRRLDYVALLGPDRTVLFGNVKTMPAIPVDGESHFIAASRAPGSGSRVEPAIFVARQRPDGNILLLGRSLLEAYALRQIVLTALATGVGPMVLLALVAGVLFARRASTRLRTIHDTIAKIMKGDMHLRLPVRPKPDEVDKVARDVNRMLDEIMRLLVQIKGVGDNIAHDLRTPLAVMRAQLERGLQALDHGELRQAARQAIGQIDRAMITIEALLRIAELEYGPKSAKLAPIDLTAIGTDLFEFFEPLARSKSIRLTLDVSSPVKILGDGDLIRQAISNLIGNAIKFTPEHGVVCVSVTEEDGRPVVRVRDNGVGVEPGERDKIFERFYRTASGLRVAGSGLGLSIAAAIANLHDFELRVEDNHPGALFEMAGRGRCLEVAP